MKRFFTLLAAGLFLLAACEPDPVLTLNPEIIAFSADGGSESVAVSANNTWNVVLENSEDFFTVSPLTGTGDGYFTVTAKANGSSSNRTAQIVVVCTSHDMSMTKVVKIEQSCPAGKVHIENVEYTPAQVDEVFSAEGGSAVIEFVTNGPWTLSCDASDVKMDLTSGSAGSFAVTATIPACPVFEGRTIKFTLVCRTSAGGVSMDFGTKQAGGVLTYGGEVYHAVKMKDGKWWMSENLRYIPSGMTPSADAAEASNGIWYPLVIDVLDESTAKVKFSQEAADIKANGYLYSTEVALGLKPGGITVDNAGTFEGVQGICPEGWHIPTKADIVGLVGKTADKNDTNPDAPYYDAELNGGNGSAAKLEADGFNANAWGAVSIANAAATKGTTMGAIKAYQRGMNTGYIAGSTMRQVTTNDDGSLKNVQYVALMPNMNTGTYNGAWNNYRNGVSVRCVKNQ